MMVVLDTSYKYKRNKGIGIHRKKSVLTDRNDCVGRGKSEHLTMPNETAHSL